MRRITFSLVAVVALAGVVTYMVPHLDTPTAGSTQGVPLRKPLLSPRTSRSRTCPGSAWSARSSTTPLGRARPRTVTPARLSSTPMSSRARSGARSMTSLSASTGPVRRGSRDPEPIIG
jgi:hypothetical protein